MLNIYWNAFISLSRKEIKRFFRVWVQTLVPPIITTTLYFFIFGKMIGGRIGNMGGATYIEFIVPGLIMMQVINSSYANVSSSFFGQKMQRNIEELLVAPVPTYVMIGGFLMGGFARSLIVGSFVTAVSLFFVPLQIHSWALTLLMLVLTSILFSLLGLINSVFAQSYDDISIVPTFILQPLTYLGGVFYTISELPPFWQGVSKFNPIVYMISGFRYGVLGMEDVSISLSIAVVVCSVFALLALAWYLIDRGIGIRS